MSCQTQPHLSSLECFRVVSNWPRFELMSLQWIYKTLRHKATKAFSVQVASSLRRRTDVSLQWIWETRLLLPTTLWSSQMVWSTNLGHQYSGHGHWNKSPGQRFFFCPICNILGISELLPTVQVLRDAYNNYRQTAEPLRGENLSAFVHRRRSFWKLVTNTSPAFPEDCYICNCPPYLQYATCKHSLGLGLHHNKLLAPPQFKGNKVEDLKRKGRPKKVGHCLSKKWEYVAVNLKLCNLFGQHFFYALEIVFFCIWLENWAHKKLWAQYFLWGRKTFFFYELEYLFLWARIYGDLTFVRSW